MQAPTAKAKRPRTALRERPVIGWVENVDLPEWRVFGLRAKADTGARSSALHVYNLREDGPRHVLFDVVIDADRGNHRHRHDVRARIARRARVRSSNGQYEVRVFVKARIRIGEVEREIELSLADRREMTHRMLLGRTSLKGLLVDASRRYLLSEE
ncbi:MAG: RimK/LysX family protein [Myxococcales bacterium]|nr:RimK/LysX family protein [Myxococcales bacterium]